MRVARLLLLDHRRKDSNHGRSTPETKNNEAVVYKREESKHARVYGFFQGGHHMHTGVHNQNNQARLWTAGINMPKWNTHAKPPQKRLQEQHLATPGYKLYREVSMPAAHTAVLWSPPPTLHSTSCLFWRPGSCPTLSQEPSFWPPSSRLF